MSEMIDRVAAAMALKAGFIWPNMGEAEDDASDEREARSYWRPLARAAIEAMREPTQDMRHACWDLLEGNARVGNLRPGQIRGNGFPDAVLHRMVDAAIKP